MIVPSITSSLHAHTENLRGFRSDPAGLPGLANTALIASPPRPTAHQLRSPPPEFLDASHPEKPHRSLELRLENVDGLAHARGAARRQAVQIGLGRGGAKERFRAFCVGVSGIMAQKRREGGRATTCAHLADAHPIRAECERLRNICAAHDAAVQDHFRIWPHRLSNPANA